MIKFVAGREGGGNVYGFGLSEANLNRMEFNDEPVFFDFGYAGRSDLFGLFVYCRECPTPESIQANLAAVVETYVLPFFDEQRGVTPETLVFFPIAQNVMLKFRQTPYWAYDLHIKIADPRDIQMIFSGPDEEAMRRYFSQTGLINPKTKQTFKGFGKWEDRDGR